MMLLAFFFAAGVSVGAMLTVAAIFYVQGAE